MNFSSFIPKKLIQRDIEPEIDKFIRDREIIVISGPRQSGKTTLLLKLAKQLAEKHGEDTVNYVSFEDDLEKLKFEKDPENYLEFFLTKNTKTFFFFDEMQYVKNGGKILKLLFDRYPKVKIFVSGSSTLDIAKLGEYLVGRAIFFELLPLSFGEFLRYKDIRLHAEYIKHRFSFDKPRSDQSLFEKDLNAILEEYLSYGGYPRLVLEKNREKKKILLRNLFTTYIEKDIIKSYGLKYKEKAVVVLKYLAEITGSVLNYHDLCQTASLHFNETKEILSVFEATYIISKVVPFHHNLVTELKKNPKYYFRDLGFRNLLLNRFEFNAHEKGSLLENYAYLALTKFQPKFWRTTAKAEVDFVLKDKIPVEVKAVPKIGRSFLSFLGSYKPEFGLIVSGFSKPEEKRGGSSIYTVPFSLL